MIGGIPHSPLTNERLFRFQFPERPGALMQFLDDLLSDWNISLFHYRNHGAAYGRVLLGLEVPVSDNQKLDDMIASIGFTFTEETNNLVFDLMLKS
jgi:threonine dehydratase